MNKNLHFHKSATRNLTLGLWVVLFLMLTSCGTDSGHFRIDGRFRHLNQGEFYVYSPDGIIDGLDTIKIQDGRFTYETLCSRKGTLVLLFPNFSEQPVFAEPGKTVDVKADASHLKELKAEGTKENKLMNSFREQVASVSPPELKKYAEQFVRDHPESLPSVYITNRYFLQDERPDYKKAKTLVALMQQHQEKNPFLTKVASSANLRTATIEGAQLPMVKATDINGKAIDMAALKKAKVGVVVLCANWNDNSMALNRQLSRLYKKAGGEMKVLTVCVDPEPTEMRRRIERDSLQWTVACDGKMFSSPLVRQLGLNNIPDNILLQKGRVVAHGMANPDLLKKIEDLLQ